MVELLNVFSAQEHKVAVTTQPFDHFVEITLDAVVYLEFQFLANFNIIANFIFLKERARGKNRIH